MTKKEIIAAVNKEKDTVALQEVVLAAQSRINSLKNDMEIRVGSMVRLDIDDGAALHKVTYIDPSGGIGVDVNGETLKVSKKVIRSTK